MYSKNTLNEDITMALAHEVKSPLSLIKANIELLELENVLDNHKKNVKIIKNEINKISEIVSDFMLFCNQNYKKDLTKINLLDLVKDYIEKFNVYMNITFSLNCFEDEKDITILSEYYKISVILSNIYKNCVESISDKQGFIQTNIYIKNNYIIIDVIDNGKGLDEEISKKIYEPFFTNKSSGSGLGIPICINAMKSINGKFEIFNNKKYGCTTRIKFKK
ncbi:HAMP domain-containing sensor histidine kinase [uncultured Tyzzerella sp.]|uniref:HAMP domain-containing sensor histidine kinase n=1 Tax=uncultured Tyzzerella sp. TaxID=2321398 RepID=UPI002941DEDF|nr:HAMP domain-containing sensor histidine kinase [uncultured Tyzzerella sp.]